MTSEELAAKLRTYNEATYELISVPNPETIAAAICEGSVIQKTAGSVHGGAAPLYSINLYAHSR